MLPKEDVVYLADRKNAPYGTKTREELKILVKNDIKRLRELGAERILVACCTASTVYRELGEEYTRGVTPIIEPAARVAAGFSRILVIATDYTVRSGAFGEAIRRISKKASVTELAMQRLVALIEGGARGGRLNGEARGELLRVARECERISADALVLGCTHFSHVEGELRGLLPSVTTVSPAREGARALAEMIKREKNVTGNGRNIYT